MQVVYRPVHEVGLKTFGEAGEEAEVFRVGVESGLDTEVEEEVGVDLVVHASGKIGLVMVLAENADILGVGTEVFGEGNPKDGGVEEFEIIVISIVDVIKLSHETKADDVGQLGGPRYDDAAFPLPIAGGGGDEGHESEGGVATVVSIKIPFKTEGEVAEGVPIVFATGADIDDGLEVHVVSETGFEVERAVGVAFDSAISAIVEE